MGQTSLKYLNRVGYNVFWGGVWESQNNYSHTFLKFLFLDSFFNKILENGVLNYFNFSNKKRFKSLDCTQSYKHINNFTYNLGFDLSNNYNSYNSKLWLLSYQNWIITFMYVYFPVRVKKNNKFFDLKNSNRLLKFESKLRNHHFF